MLTLLIYIFMIILNGVVALYDFSFYRIPNMLVLSMVILYFCSAPFMLNINEVLMSSAIFAATLFIGFVLFFFGVFGGGDAKYLAATSMWAGADHVIPFFLIVAFCGGILALTYLLGQSRIAIYSTNLWNQILLLEQRYTTLQYVWTLSGQGSETHNRKSVEKNQIPYGVAISVGMIAVLYLKMTS